MPSVATFANLNTSKAIPPETNRIKNMKLNNVIVNGEPIADAYEHAMTVAKYPEAEPGSPNGGVTDYIYPPEQIRNGYIYLPIAIADQLAPGQTIRVECSLVATVERIGNFSEQTKEGGKNREMIAVRKVWITNIRDPRQAEPILYPAPASK